jgi:acetyltransferase-like isoleucine patch superfamily enzyme
MNVLSRFFVLRKIETDNGLFLFSRDTEVRISKGAKIIVRNGMFRAGYAMNESDPFSHFSKTKIFIGENATLEINGDVNFGPGSTLILNSGSHFIFGGANVIAHNNLFYCYKKIQFGRNSCTSWACQFIDSDGHSLFSSKNGGRLIEPLYRPLIVDENVGFQMNVSVPRGLSIGRNSLVSSGIILREDVPEESLVLLEQEIRIKKGIMTPYGKET